MKTKIDDVEVKQKRVVQNRISYLIILGQPYIISTRMATKVLDDGSDYAKIQIYDGKWDVEFLTVRPEYERHREQLRKAPMGNKDEDL